MEKFDFNLFTEEGRTLPGVHGLFWQKLHCSNRPQIVAKTAIKP
jgi:hypothetical protein